MSSPNNGPYRSRLFNLINRQSRRLIVKSGRATRHLKVAAIWGVQILLYPIYLLVQASLSASRQLLQEARSGWPTLKALTQSQPPQTPLTADTPIQRVLKEVKILPLPTPSGLAASVPNFLSVVSGEWSVEKTAVDRQAIANNGQLINKTQKQTNQQGLVIQGVATLLPERTLVLVSVENQILDILTPQQQHKLLSRITWEVANLMRQRRLLKKADLKKAASRLSTLDHPPLFLPLRLFWRLMAWVQTSPVAIAVNLFGESALVNSTAKSSSPIHLPRAVTQFLVLLRRQSSALKNQIKVPQEALTTLDRQVAQLEAHPLVTDSPIAIARRD
ncbi:MAG TPA: hypothetical protein DDZ80_19035, partial [Cyanobacteria bacterium UBA8803]|nr:hypothetical protein [Cyanobacteria bacterium UBA8803]